MLTPEEQEQPLKAELDELLLSEIETRLATGVYGPDKRHQVRLYLDQKALALEKAAQADQVEIARAANTRATIAPRIGRGGREVLTAPQPQRACWLMTGGCQPLVASRLDRPPLRGRADKGYGAFQAP